jgi:acetate CoA/acetoacetate CoA-transferase beta subunit
LPYTALGVVDLIVTEMGVMEVTPEGILLKELHPDFTLDEIKAATGCDLIIAENLKPMKVE